MRIPGKSTLKIRAARRRQVALSFEPVEPRLLMASGFIGGYVSHSAGGVVAGATIELFNSNATTLLQTTTTDSDGYYHFDNVAPATYTVEEAEVGYVTTAANAVTTINPASTINADTAFSVTVVDPSTQTVQLTRQADPYTPLLTYYTVAGGPFNVYTEVGDTTHQYNLALSGNQGNSSSDIGLCTDLYHGVSPGDTYLTTPSLTPQSNPTAPPTTSAANIGRIGYLYNEFGSSLLDPTDGAGLQLAIWELLYDTTDDLFSGNYALNATGNDPNIVAAATNYLSLSQGKDEDAYFLNVRTPSGSAGGQSMISTDLLNFTSSPAASIAGNVYVDNAGLGHIAAGDAPIPGTTLTLADSLGNTVATTTTAANGSYLFTTTTLGQPIAPGTYKVTESQPAGYLQGSNTVGTVNGVTDGSLAPVDMIASIVLTSGQASVANNFGELLPVTVAGNVYLDNAGLGHIAAGDAPISGVVLSLTDSNGNTVATTTTGANGSYSFTTTTAGQPIAPGTYKVTESQPAGYLQGSNTVGTVNGVTDGSLAPVDMIGSITLTSGQASVANNFGELLPVTVGGNVYVDAGNVGHIAPGDAPIPGTTLTLTDSLGNTVATTTTAANGSYLFTTTTLGQPIAPGTYKVTESQPAGYFQGSNTVGTVNGVTDGTLLPVDMIASIVLTSGQASVANNFGELVPDSISGVVYVDATGVGLTGPLNSPPPVNPANPTFVDTVEAGVKVTFYAVGSTTPLASTTTGPNGTYSFIGLTPGNYTVQESTPGGYVETYPTGGIYTVAATGYGVNYPNNNFANFMQSCNAASLTNVVYKDNGCVIPGLRGHTNQGDTVSVTFTVPKTVATETLSLVAYSAPGSSFSASDASQQAIVGLQTGTFTPGTYTLTVTLPNSYYQVDFVCGAAITQFGPANSNIFYSAQGRLIDADNDGCNAYALSTLSGVVFIDTNGNGSYGTGDTGLGGVTLTLSGTTNAGVPVPPNDTTVSAANGTYSFGNLAPGNYTVTETLPGGYTAEVANIGNFGGSAAVGSASKIALNSNVAATGYNFGEAPPTASLTGIAYADLNVNGVYNQGIDSGIAGAKVTLTGTTSYGVPYTLTTTTDCNGVYSFPKVVTGTYTITESLPSGYSAETSNLGNAGGSAGLGSTSSVNLTSGLAATGYNFGDKVTNPNLGCYQTCSTNFWYGQNGQSLINCVNGGSGSRNLGNWLASTLPNLCGSYAGKTNSQVASSFQWLCWTSSCNANIVATALAAYCTNTSLAGCNAAASYGFQTDSGGSGHCTVNVGNTFAGYGGPCGNATLLQLLSFADSQSTTWGHGTTSQSSVSSCFSSINNCSRIG